MLERVLSASKNFVTYSGKSYWLSPCISTAARQLSQLISADNHLRKS